MSVTYLVLEDQQCSRTERPHQLITNLQSGKKEVMHLRSNYGGHTHLVAMDTFWEMNCDESPNLCRWSSWKAWLHLPVNQQFVPLPDNPEKTKRVYVHGYVCIVHCTYVFVAPDSYCFLHFVLYQEMLVMPNGMHARMWFINVSTCLNLWAEWGMSWYRSYYNYYPVNLSNVGTMARNTNHFSSSFTSCRGTDQNCQKAPMFSESFESCLGTDQNCT